MVTDSEGSSAFATQTITVSTAPAASATLAPITRVDSPRAMSPFPVVRISGSIRRRGSKLRLLSVTAPTGATVLVRCAGRSCPVGRQSQVVTSGKGSKGDDTAHVVRIRRLEGKLLRSGTRINIFVTKPGTIGKYTSFRIRSGRAPARADKCLVPGSGKPVTCAAS
jgi:hypothetical protein